MDIKTAYAKVKKLPGRNALLACVDLGGRWAFQFHVKALKPGDFLVGGYCDAVDKRTGRIEQLSMGPDTRDIFQAGRPIDIKQFEGL
jgi:hypothetical protein